MKNTDQDIEKKRSAIEGEAGALRKNLKWDRNQLDEILALYGKYVEADIPFPLDLEEHSLRLLLEFVRPDDSDAAARLAQVLALQGKSATEELLQVVRDKYIEKEYAVDYQHMLDDYSNKVQFRDMEPEFFPLIEEVRHFSMTTIERLYSLWTCVRYLVNAGIGGDFAEAGVWRGGSTMLMAREILRLGARPRDLWLYDTFSGLPRPDAKADVDVLGNQCIDGWNMHRITEDTSIWAYADENEVRRNMASTGYPADRMHFVAGLVEETVPGTSPDQIALLRIDTDWHASYKHLLETLYDRIVPGGVLLLDDYGHMLGARRAVDEFRSARGIHAPLHRVDYSCRLMIKT